jgi:hypothetical protein
MRSFIVLDYLMTGNDTLIVAAGLGMMALVVVAGVAILIKRMVTGEW